MSNRYTNISPSQFNPLTMEEIFSVPLMKQKKHDQTQAQLDEMGIFDLNRLQADDDTAKQYINDYRDRIDAETDSIMSKGISNQSVRNVRNLVRDKNKWMSNDGVGGKIQANYKAFQDYKTTLDEALKRGDIRNDRYHGLLNQAVKEYQGVVNNGKLNLEAAAYDSGYQEKATEIAKAVSDNPRKIESLTNLTYDPKTNKYVSKDREYTEEDAIRMAVVAGLKLDASIMGDLDQRQRLGLFGDTTINDHINSIGDLNEFIYSKNNQKLDFISEDRDKSKGSKGVDGGDPYLITHVGNQKFKQYDTLEDLQSAANSPMPSKARETAIRRLKQYKGLFKNNDDYKKIVSEKQDYLDAVLPEVEPEVRNKIATSTGSSNEWFKSQGKYYANVGGKIIQWNKNTNPNNFSNGAYTPAEILASNQALGHVDVIGSYDPEKIRKADARIEGMYNEKYNTLSNQFYTYNVNNLKPSIRTGFEDDMRRNLIDGNFNNYEILDVNAIDEDGDELSITEDFFNKNKDQKITVDLFNKLKQASPSSFEVQNIQFNSISNTPSATIRFKTGEKGSEETYTIEVGLDKLRDINGIQSGEARAIDFIETNGGADGKKAAKNLREGIKYKDIKINYEADDFNDDTSNSVQNNLMSSSLNNKLKSKYGDNYKTNLYHDSGDNTYKLQVGKNKWASWADIIDSENLSMTNDNMIESNIAKQQALLRYIIQNDLITPEELRNNSGEYNMNAINKVYNDILRNPNIHIIQLDDKYKLFDLLKKGK